MASTTCTGKVGGRLLSAVGVSVRVGAIAAALSVIPFLAWSVVGPAAAAEYVLSKEGTRLGILYTTGKVDDLRFIVDLNGDQPVATYVWATVGSNDLRVRTNEGYWLPWNGDPDTLIDNHFPINDGKVIFKVLDEDIGRDNHGVTIRIGYKVGDVLKYGVFGILPKGAGE